MLSLLLTTDDTRCACLCSWTHLHLWMNVILCVFVSSFSSSYSISLTQEGFTALCKGDSSLIDDQTSLILAFAIGENTCILMIIICHCIQLRLIEWSTYYSIYRNHESVTQACTIAQMHVQSWWWNMWWVIIYPSLPHTTLCCASMDSSSHSMCVHWCIHSHVHSLHSGTGLFRFALISLFSEPQSQTVQCTSITCSMVCSCSLTIPSTSFHWYIRAFVAACSETNQIEKIVSLNWTSDLRKIVVEYLEDAGEHVCFVCMQYKSYLSYLMSTHTHSMCWACWCSSLVHSRTHNKHRAKQAYVSIFVFLQTIRSHRLCFTAQEWRKCTH